MLRLGKQQNPPTGTYGVNRGSNQAVASHRQNRSVSPTAFGLPSHFGDNVRMRGIDHAVESEISRYCKPRLVQIGSDYAHSCTFCQCTQYDTDGPLADDKNRFAGFQRHPLDALHAGVDRLDEAGLLETCLLRDANSSLLYDPIHYANVVG